MMSQKENISAVYESRIITILKSLAIILVVSQHAMAFINTTFSSVLSKVFYAIDVNVFFFISGYLFECKKSKYLNAGLKKFVLKKAVQLVVPYLFYSSALYFIICIGNSIERLKPVFESIGFSTISFMHFIINTITYRNYYVEMYWFIYVLFVVFVAEYIRTALKVDNLICIAIVFMALSLLEGICPAFIILKLSVSWIVFICGRLYAEHGREFGTVTARAAGISMIIFMIIAVRRNIYTISGSVPRVLYYMFYNFETVIWGICAVVFLSFVLSRFVDKFELKCLKYLGKHSYTIYLLHNPYIVAVTMTILLRLRFPSFGSVLIAVILGLSIPCFVEQILISNKILSLLCLGVWKGGKHNSES